LDKHALTITVDSIDGVPIIRAAGELDLATVPEMRVVVNEVTERQPRALVFDFRKIVYLDSSGLGILVSAKKRLGAYRGEVVVLTQQNSVLKALSLSGLDQIIRVFPSEEGYRDAGVAAAH
jgi:anti-sigma B factor antagonist